MKPTILFDFDGVIVDSFHISYAYREEGGTPLTIEEFRKLHEGNIYEEIAKNQSRKSEVELNENHEKFFAYYSEQIIEQVPFEGIEDVLATLAERYPLVVVSSSIDNPIKAYLDRWNLSQYFQKIYSADVHRSKVVKMKMVFEEFSTDAEHCIFIIDTLGDVREANKVGVPSVGVTWGCHDRPTLKRGEPHAIVDTPAELQKAVEGYFR